MQSAPWLAASALALSLSSGCGTAMQGMCGMGGMGAMHGGSSHASGPPATRVVKEVRTETMFLTLDVPALRVGQEETMTLSAVDATTGQPAVDLAVTFALRPVGAGAQTHGPGHAGDAEEAAVGKVATEVYPGTYAVTHTFGQPGTVEIAATASRDSMPPSTARVTQDVHPSSGSHAACGGHGEASRSLTPLAVLGGVATAVMMVLMMAWL